jgi:hypothetical protein
MAIGSGKGFQYFTEQISGAGVGWTRPTRCFWHRPVSPRPNLANKIALPLSKIARVLVRFDHVTRCIVNRELKHHLHKGWTDAADKELQRRS